MADTVTLTNKYDDSFHYKSDVTFRDYIIYSTIFSSFGLIELFKINSSTIWLGYLVLIFNSILLLSVRKLVLPKKAIQLLGIIGGASLLAAYISHSIYTAVITQIAGIAIFISYYYSALLLRHGSIFDVFVIYRKVVFFLAIIGIFLYFITFLITGHFERLTSIFSEPSFFVYATLPSLSYALFGWRNKKNLIHLLILVPSYVLADSSIGFIGILLTLLMIMRSRSIFKIVISAIFLFGFATIIFYTSENVRVRVIDTVKTQVIMNEFEARREILADPEGPISVEDSNSSTRALLSNAYVAYRAFISNPFIGTGIGTHMFSYDQYAPEVLKNKDDPLYGLNKFDANSTLLRAASEGGLFGITLIFYLIYYFSRVLDPSRLMLRDALLPCIFVMMLRQGSYFTFTLDFILVIFVFNYLEDVAERSSNSRHLQPLEN